jgi:predicted aspartyl protease
MAGAMGIFSVDVRVARPGRRPRWRTFRRVMVDTGAEMTWLPEAGLRAAGIDVFKRDQLFVMANGQYVTRHVGTVVIECGEFKTVDEVVFAQPGDLSLLGARTLEGFHAVVDARKKKLVAAGPIPAAPTLPPQGTSSKAAM